MKNIIPEDSRYVPMTQQKSCCVPTSISIVMYKLGTPLVSQELLGYHLGLIVDEKNKDFFWNPRTGERPLAGYGTQIGLEEYNPDIAFEKLNIPLRMVVHSVDEFELREEDSLNKKEVGRMDSRLRGNDNRKDFVTFVSDCINEDRDILACFNHGTLKGDGSSNGHTCVVDRIYPEKNIIRLIDPSPNQPKWRELAIDKFKKAMENHPINKGGFWEIIRK